MKWSSFKYLVKQGWHSMVANRLMTLASIGVLVACLMITGVAALLSVNVTSYVDYLETLNEIVFFHVGRAVKHRKAQAEASGKPIFAIDAINLLESGMGALCDKTVCVLAPKEVRMQRIMARDGLTEPAARARIDAQKPDDFYRANCRYTLQNTQTLEAFREKARRLLNDILKEEPL